MDGDGRKTVATHHHGVFPGNFRAGGDLAERDHPPGDRAPDLQAVNRVDVTALGERWTCDDRQQPRLLRENATAAAAWFAIKADSAPSKPSSNARATSTRVIPLRARAVRGARGE